MRDYDSPELGQALLDEVGDATGIDMTATGFRFNLFSGMELDNVTATSRSEGRSFYLSLDQLVFEHRIWPLLSGTVAIDRIVLDRPQCELVEASSSAGAEASAEAEVEVESETGSAEDAEGPSMALEISQILVRDGTIVIKSADGSSETRVEGLDFTMENLTFDPTEESLAALSAEGELTITQIVLDTITMSDLKSTFQLAGAVFDLTELTFRTPHGNFCADARIDFNPVPFTYTMSAQGDPLDLNSMTGASEGLGRGRFDSMRKDRVRRPKTSTRLAGCS